MKEDYLLWKRVVEEFKNAVDKAESELIVNTYFLKKAKKQLKKFPKPKDDQSTKNPVVM